MRLADSTIWATIFVVAVGDLCCGCCTALVANCHNIKKASRVKPLLPNGTKAGSLVSGSTAEDAEYAGDSQEEAVSGMVNTSCYWQCTLMWHA